MSSLTATLSLRGKERRKKTERMLEVNERYEETEIRKKRTEWKEEKREKKSKKEREKNNNRISKLFNSQHSAENKEGWMHY